MNKGMVTEMNARRFVVSGVAAIGIIVSGAASANAWTWAKSTSPIKMTGGGGYGNLVFLGTRMTLESTLSDTRVGDGRVYARTGAYRPDDTNYLNSGLRSDGEASYARMADKYIYLPALPGNYQLYAELCRSVTLNDPCSTDKRYN